MELTFDKDIQKSKYYSHKPTMGEKSIETLCHIGVLRRISFLISAIPTPPSFSMLDFLSLEFASFLYNIEKGEGGGVGSQSKPV